MKQLRTASLFYRFCTQVAKETPKAPKYLQYQTEEQFKVTKSILSQITSLDESKVEAIVERYPRILKGDFNNNIKEAESILKLYAGLSSEEIGKLSIKYPYLLEIKPQNTERNLRNLLSSGLRQKDIKEILENHCEVLAISPDHFNIVLIIYRDLVPVKKTLKQLYIQHPRLLLLCPHTMVAPKINIFKNLGLDLKQIGQIFQLYPTIFIKSVGSLKLKLNYLEKLHKVDLIKESYFPKILTHSYWKAIRPRGELLRKAKAETIDWKQVLELSEADFLAKYKFNQEDLQQLLDQAPQGEELDVRKRYFDKFLRD